MESVLRILLSLFLISKELFSCFANLSKKGFGGVANVNK